MQCDVKRATCDADAAQTVPKVTTLISRYSQQHARGSMLAQSHVAYNTHVAYNAHVALARRAVAHNAWHRHGTGPSEHSVAQRRAAQSSAALRSAPSPSAAAAAVQTSQDCAAGAVQCSAVQRSAVLELTS